MSRYPAISGLKYKKAGNAANRESTVLTLCENRLPVLEFARVSIEYSG